MRISLGLIDVIWDDFEGLLRLTNLEEQKKQANNINKLIGEEVSVLLDTVVQGRNYKAAYHDIDESETSVIIVKAPVDTTRPWWFKRTTQDTSTWVLLGELTGDERLQIGKELTLKFPNKMVPVGIIAEKAWWLRQQRNLIQAYAMTGMQKDELQKAINNIVTDKYSTLVTRLMYNEVL